MQIKLINYSHPIKVSLFIENDSVKNDSRVSAVEIEEFKNKVHEFETLFQFFLTKATEACQVCDEEKIKEYVNILVVVERALQKEGTSFRFSQIY